MVYLGEQEVGKVYVVVEDEVLSSKGVQLVEHSAYEGEEGANLMHAAVGAYWEFLLFVEEDQEEVEYSKHELVEEAGWEFAWFSEVGQVEEGLRWARFATSSHLLGQAVQVAEHLVVEGSSIAPWIRLHTMTDRHRVQRAHSRRTEQRKGLLWLVYE